MFSTKILILFTLAIFYTHLLYPAVYYFPLAHTLLSFKHAFTHNSHYYLFWKDIIIYGRKRKKDVYYFWKKNK